MLPASGRQISGHLPAFGSIRNQTDSDTFLVASLFDAVCSAFCWLSLFPLWRLSGLITSWLFCWSRQVAGRASVWCYGTKLLEVKPSRMASRVLVRCEVEPSEVESSWLGIIVSQAWVSDHLSSHLWLSFLKTASGPRRNSPLSWITHLHPTIHQDPSAYNPLNHLELHLDLLSLHCYHKTSAAM